MPPTLSERLPRLVMALLLAVIALPRAFAQDDDFRFSIGGGVGMTGYLGDANTSNLWQNPGWDAEVHFRYLNNPRWAFKTSLYAGSLRGDSSEMTNVFPQGNTYKFSTMFYELGELAEFNFFNFGTGPAYRKLRRISPYITAGVSLTLWKTNGKTGIAFTLPFGAGVKYKLSERWDLGLEFLMKKVFTDRLDGEQLDDPLGIKSTFMKNTDWYSTMSLTVSYEFGRRCAICNYKD